MMSRNSVDGAPGGLKVACHARVMPQMLACIHTRRKKRSDAVCVGISCFAESDSGENIAVTAESSDMYVVFVLL